MFALQSFLMLKNESRRNSTLGTTVLQKQCTFVTNCKKENN